MNFITAIRAKLTLKVFIVFVVAVFISGLLVWGMLNKESSFFNFWRKYNFETIIPSGVEISKNAKTPDEAVSDALLVSGYEKESPSQVEALPDSNGQIEYWSVKTDKGYITVKAKP